MPTSVARSLRVFLHKSPLPTPPKAVRRQPDAVLRGYASCWAGSTTKRLGLQSEPAGLNSGGVYTSVLLAMRSLRDWYEDRVDCDQARLCYPPTVLSQVRPRPQRPPPTPPHIKSPF